MEGLLELVSPLDMLLYMINFFILFFVARHFLYKPVTKFIDARTEKMRLAREEIEKGLTEIDDVKRRQRTDYEAYLAKGEAEASERLSRADEDAKGIVAGAKEEASEIIAKARVAADEEITKARGALREEIAQLSVQLSSRILEREVKPEDHEMLIDEFLNKVG